MTQPGIFGLGAPEHCYLEFSLQDGASPTDLVKAVAGLTGPLSTGGGVNLVVGFRPELWAQAAPDHAPSGVRGFTEPIVGADGFQMPATQRDAWAWVAGSDRTAVFNNSRNVIAALAGIATVASEVTGWVYEHDRDLTGFIDGTENPSLLVAPGVAVVADGPGAGSSVLLFQRWRHDSDTFQTLPVEEQERVIGRTKADSVELDEAVMPPTSHVSRTVVEEDGEELKIFRRNTAYGTVTEHGTMFVGFSHEQRTLDLMLRRMAGATEDGLRDELTRYTTPVSGAYYVIPSVTALARFAPEDDD
ncbi:peroxidase [Parafrankia colletiae]|uniref:Peroxidase n=1 Tax=Parafrankia colletiae TaxID=573497 RepID=A0A1S1QYD1_9ACTN|nr:Dyp-type peroxidase [Parafrankia colletiae]MCK9904648.1 Dyp-type peroxidase [Frankia sp. Cpl3]OHV38626.1 peroxidase [Parafrankia colletiae]